MLRAGMFDYVPKEYIDAYPTLAALESTIATHPIIAAWEQSQES
jgi:hypothetical protein